MSGPVARVLTYDDLARFGQDDHLLVEVSSPTTRRLDLVKKRNLYEREGVAEYWFVDLDADRVDVYRLDATGRYGLPTTLGPGATLTCLAAPGLALIVAEALAC